MSKTIDPTAAAPSLPSISTATTQKPHPLPEAIIANGQWLVADMDGTLIGAPGYKKEPTLAESVAKEAIFDWLRSGGYLLVLTSCETKRTIERFADHIPKDLNEALMQKRLLLATNGGAVISYFDGARWTEDSNFQLLALATPIAITDEGQLLDRAVAVINDFYKALRENDKLIPDALKTRYAAIIDIAKNKHPHDFTLAELATLNSDIVPRIEIRKAENNKVVQIAVIGIPVDLGYDVSKLALGPNLEMVKIGVTHEINLKGVDKALPIRWLQGDCQLKIGYPKFDIAKSVAVGDRPNHNDAPLTKAVGAFVSVCENNTPAYIPSHVTLRIGGNQEGTRKLILNLLAKANEFDKAKRHEPVLVHALNDAVNSAK